MPHIHSILGGKSLIAQHDGYPGYGRLGQPGTDVKKSFLLNVGSMLGGISLK